MWSTIGHQHVEEGFYGPQTLRKIRDLADGGSRALWKAMLRRMSFGPGDDQGAVCD